MPPEHYERIIILEIHEEILESIMNPDPQESLMILL